MQAKPANLLPAAARVADWPAPRWAVDLVGGEPRVVADDGRLAVSVAESAAHALVTARARGVDALPPAAVEAATADAYAAIAARLAGLAAAHPVRFWNYIPGIHRPSGADAAGRPLDRYMVFNAGRHAACSRWLGGEAAFPRLLATASGVGHADGDLVVHALAAAVPGVAVENPRQVPAYRYSRRYGPKPPCFARATVVAPARAAAGRPMILVGGTASVRGEASVHVGDLGGQMAETVENLTALLRAATGEAAAGVGLLTDVRVYHVREADLPALRTMCDRAFAAAARLEFVRADLCRQDLLVEIEGVAVAAPRAAAAAAAAP